MADIFDNERFNLYTDKNGKYWLWDKSMKQNHAIKANSEIEAYQQSINSLIFIAGLIQGHRKTAESNLERLLGVFREIEPSQDSWD